VQARFRIEYGIFNCKPRFYIVTYRASKTGNVDTGINIKEITDTLNDRDKLLCAQLNFVANLGLRMFAAIQLPRMIAHDVFALWICLESAKLRERKVHR